MKEEICLMKGNEAVAHAAVRSGCDGYFGYPITPQTEIMETLMELRPWESTGMVVLQAESEVASINMLYGGAACGKRVMTSSSSPGISLMCEGISYIAGAELPCVIVNVQRGGPGLGTIQPSQSDYFQAVKGGGHGDYHMVVLAPNSVQEMYDFVFESFDIAFRYRIPVMMLADGVVGQMMEKVVMSRQRPRNTEQQVVEQCGGWAVTGMKGRGQNVVTSLSLDPVDQEQTNLRLQAKYRQIEAAEVRYEEVMTEDADFVMVAFGISSRVCAEVVSMARADGYKVGLLRPITLWPFPYGRISELAERVKGFMSVELNAGQMIEDVRLAVCGRAAVEHCGRMGGIIATPGEIYSKMKEMLIDRIK